MVNGSSRFLNEIQGKIDWTNILNKPTIPTVNNATLTIQKNGTNVQTFTANQSTNATANITVPTKVSELTNDSGYTKNTGTVTSVKISATSPIAIDSSAAITTSGTRTISHANSGVTAGTYRSVTVNATGHVTAGTNPTTLSGYGITDAKIVSGTITLGSNTITPLTSSSTLDATKLSGTIPSSCYTDTNNAVTQTATDSTDATYELLFSGTADNTTRTEGARKTQYLKYNPSDMQLTVNDKLLVSTFEDVETIPQIQVFQNKNSKSLTVTSTDITLDNASHDSTWDGTNTSLKSAISSKANVKDETLIHPISVFRLKNTTDATNSYPRVEFRESGTSTARDLSLVYQPNSSTNTINVLVDQNGAFLPGMLKIKQIQELSFSISSAVAAYNTANATASISNYDSSLTYTFFMRNGSVYTTIQNYSRSGATVTATLGNTSNSSHTLSAKAIVIGWTS